MRTPGQIELMEILDTTEKEVGLGADGFGSDILCRGAK